MSERSVKGFTLIEVVVGSALGLLLIASVLASLTLGRVVWQDTEARVATLQEARKALSAVTLDLPRSSWSSPEGIAIAVDGSMIRFQIPQSMDSGIITWGDIIRYRVGENSQLLRENLSTGETRVAANFISDITFGTLVDHPTVVTVAVRSQKTSLSTRPFENVLQTNLSLRN